MARMFSDEHLDVLATPTSIHLERAARSGDFARLGWIADQMDAECLAIYDAYVTWIGVLQRFIIEHAGEAGHDRALTWVGEYAARPFVRQYEGLGPRERALKLAARLRASGSTFDVVEDERCVRFVLDPWGPLRWLRGVARADGAPAGRTDRGDRLRYPCHDEDGGPSPHAVISGPRAWTLGRAALPALLATEIQFLEEIPIELFGFPLAVVSLGEDPGGPCTLDVYKDPSDVPEDAYARVGAAKPLGKLGDEQRSRLFSDEELERLATPLSLQVRAAGAAHDVARLLQISSAMDAELVGAKDPIGIAIAGLLSWIAWHLGEASVERALEQTAAAVMPPFLSAIEGLGVEEAMSLWAMVWRSHGSTFWIEEQKDTILFRGRPLGACHRMYSSAYQPRVQRLSESRVRYPTFGCFEPPASFHLMREPRAITHNKTGYPVYSCHCHMLHEIYPIDQLGHPLWVEEHNLEDPDGEMVHIHYKDPAAWPRRYYEQVGRSKPGESP